jgi:hypothetical protein
LEDCLRRFEHFSELGWTMLRVHFISLSNVCLVSSLFEVKPPGRFQVVNLNFHPDQVVQELKRNLLSQGLELKLRDITVEGVLKEKAVMLHRLCLGK